MRPLTPIPTRDIARQIARALCEWLDQEYQGKDAGASEVRTWLTEHYPDHFPGARGTERFLHWLKGLGLLYQPPRSSGYGRRRNWRQALEQADWETEPGKWGSLRSDMQPGP